MRKRSEYNFKAARSSRQALLRQLVKSNIIIIPREAWIMGTPKGWKAQRMLSLGLGAAELLTFLHCLVRSEAKPTRLFTMSNTV
jgi:hypothetical protein